jgi:RHH-type proline utilization regulon transcriptional repressor/proline dehydrogenase/delta 1-pyrroline-5-carboxylate dehydrogenase
MVIHINNIKQVTKLMIFAHNSFKPSALRDAITSAYRSDETILVNDLLKQAAFSPAARQNIDEKAKQLVEQTRQNRKKRGSLDAFLHEYDLSSEEGIALMCLSEALLRIPDRETIDRLISDKISSAAWKEHLNKNGPLFVNAATWSLILTGKIFAPTLETEKSLTNSLKQLMSRTGGAVIRPIILQGMKIIGKQFVMGTTIDEALERAKAKESAGYRYSYDMLGEAARTQEDAERYFTSYVDAIAAIGKAANGAGPIQSPGISVKLSALHPRYELAKRDRVLAELAPKLLTLVQAAKQHNIGLTVDAEEADRLDLSLDIFEKVYSDPSLQGYTGFGLVVQAYQKRAPFVLDWLTALTKQHQRRIMLRLVKGAYWDSEIKVSQVLGLEGYPVFTRKNSTDLSYVVCAKKLFANPDCFYPQFGSHNARTVATILEIAGTSKDFEFQCLHGMGEALYDPIVAQQIPTRIYAPVGTHKDLLGYLVRRLLENGANTSFINHIADETTPVEKIIADPIARIETLANKPHPYIPLPRFIYLQQDQDLSTANVNRLNSQGLDLSNLSLLNQLKQTMDQANKEEWLAGPIIAGDLITRDTKQAVVSPSDSNHIVGYTYKAAAEDVETALTEATKASKTWATTSIEERATCLERAADLFEKNMPRLMTILCREGGKQIVDCVSEVRETIDFCRYYAARARKDLRPEQLTSPTGEFDQLSLHPRGVIACISPWNFPLAIFAGQVLAALVTGNTVIAKPAEQTPLIAAEAVRILHAAGIPAGALQLLPGKGSIVGAKLTADERIAGVMFTGSTETAKLIQQTLTNREGPIVPFIAETGGQNCMIVDSSALPEQVVMDVINSAFNSAGQRCSALRVLFVQEDIAPSIITMLQGAMAELTLGDPGLLATDIGPVIDQDALQILEAHSAKMQTEATLLCQVPTQTLPNGNFFAPRAFELKDLSVLKREVFGPILHVIRYAAKDLDNVLSAITNTGYGLTLGIHTRIDATINYITQRMPVGNIYVNRNMIGAVVGVQPFGGEGLSGTGPKAGGPHYLPRLCVERAISINTTAAGGNATLVSLTEDD